MSAAPTGASQPVITEYDSGPSRTLDEALTELQIRVERGNHQDSSQMQSTIW